MNRGNDKTLTATLFPLVSLQGMCKTKDEAVHNANLPLKHTIPSLRETRSISW
ncbi:hypothetical protein [Helicobacter rodentium]|uniref:hypothetical protein n=1 Tax=Helicobacter rodentium TaxID=59617 RepID=UPI002354AA53|nr:hypothetical protein [Helicobacter rodentium]